MEALEGRPLLAMGYTKLAKVECGDKCGFLVGGHACYKSSSPKDYFVVCGCLDCCQLAPITCKGSLWTLAEFEKHGGRGTHRKHADSIRVVEGEEDGTRTTLGRWLDSKTRALGSSIVGRRIKVFWPFQGPLGEWFAGTVASYNQHKEYHLVSYDDGTSEGLKLVGEHYCWLASSTEAPPQPAEQQQQPVAREVHGAPSEQEAVCQARPVAKAARPQQPAPTAAAAQLRQGQRQQEQQSGGSPSVELDPAAMRVQATELPKPPVASAVTAMMTVAAGAAEFQAAPAAAAAVAEAAAAVANLGKAAVTAADAGAPMEAGGQARAAVPGAQPDERPRQQQDGQQQVERVKEEQHPGVGQVRPLKRSGMWEAGKGSGRRGKRRRALPRRGSASTATVEPGQRQDQQQALVQTGAVQQRVAGPCREGLPPTGPAAVAKPKRISQPGTRVPANPAPLPAQPPAAVKHSEQAGASPPNAGAGSPRQAHGSAAAGRRAAGAAGVAHAAAPAAGAPPTGQQAQQAQQHRGCAADGTGPSQTPAAASSSDSSTVWEQLAELQVILKAAGIPVADAARFKLGFATCGDQLRRSVLHWELSAAAAAGEWEVVRGWVSSWWVQQQLGST